MKDFIHDIVVVAVGISLFVLSLPFLALGAVISAIEDLVNNIKEEIRK